MLCHVTPRQVVSRLEMRTLNSRTRNLKIVCDVRKTLVSQSNNAKCHETSHETFCTQGDQIKRKIFISRCQFVECNEFNPIYIIVLKTGISSSLHTIILRIKTQTKHPIALIFISVPFPCKRIRYLKTISINTHIDCSNNSKCSVRHSLGNQTRSLWKCLLQHFLLD